MPQGLQVWDENGVLMLEVTDRISRVLGTVQTTAGVAGSVTDARFSTGTPFYQVRPVNQQVIAGVAGFIPSVTISGNTLSWNYPPADSIYNRYPAEIVYGVF